MFGERGVVVIWYSDSIVWCSDNRGRKQCLDDKGYGFSIEDFSTSLRDYHSELDQQKTTDQTTMLGICNKKRSVFRMKNKGKGIF